MFQGIASDGRLVAIKRLKVDAVGPVGREMELAGYFLGHSHPHVIGIFDVGQDTATGDVFIVMERAQQREVAHRDLKPANILLHQGVWKIADLGLARFLEASTAPITMRDFLSFQYCAPEQLNAERPTKATDVYALGGIAYALLTGNPPFPGPSPVDYAQQHRYEVPRRLHFIPALAQLALDCLSKSPAVRPTLQSIRSRIQKMRASLGVSLGPSQVAEASHLLAEKRAVIEANKLKLQKTKEDRHQSAKEAIPRLELIVKALFNSIIEDAEMGSLHPDGNSIKVGKAGIFWGLQVECFEKRLKCRKLNWDILVAAEIAVAISRSPGLQIRGRSANLLFARMSRNDGFRWWEVAFVSHDQHHLRPFHLDFDTQSDELFNIEALEADIFANPVPIDGEGEEDFIARWKGVLGAAAMWEFNSVNPFDNHELPKAMAEEFYLID